MSDDLSALKALAEKATPGPWIIHPKNRSLVTTPVRPSEYVGESRPTLRAEIDGPSWAQDAAFIVALVNAWPALLARVEEAEGALEEIHGIPCWIDPITKRGGYDVDGDEWNMIRAITKRVLYRSKGADE